MIKTAAPVADRGEATERMALKTAAAELASTLWPAPDAVSLTQRLTGIVSSGNRVTREDAVDVYVGRLDDSPIAQSTLMADARSHLDRAQSVIELAGVAAQAPNPKMSDVALVEGAIADLRQIGAVYLAAFESLGGEEAAAGALERRFDDAIKGLGEAADRLADAVLSNRARSYAEPGGRSSS